MAEPKQKTKKARELKDAREEEENERRPLVVPMMKPAHPLSCLFHVGFKLVSILAFMFMGLFTRSNVSVFITVLLSACLDFWTTKNVTGRYLIGLRWWSAADFATEEDIVRTIDEDDEGHGDKKEDEPEWHFESYDTITTNSMLDANIFWWGQGGASIFWSIMLVLKVIGLNMFWGMLVFICCSLTVMNLYAYYLAMKDHEAKMQEFYYKEQARRKMKAEEEEYA
jgi:Eukaryotic protein of unknown function (DUF846)